MKKKQVKIKNPLIVEESSSIQNLEQKQEEQTYVYVNEGEIKPLKSSLHEDVNDKMDLYYLSQPKVMPSKPSKVKEVKHIRRNKKNDEDEIFDYDYTLPFLENVKEKPQIVVEEEETYDDETYDNYEEKEIKPINLNSNTEFEWAYSKPSIKTKKRDITFPKKKFFDKYGVQENDFDRGD